MLLQALKKYNSLRKKKYFSSPLFNTKKKYAFVGLGMHSLSNFYPLLKHHNIALKYICTRQSSWQNEVSMMFPGAEFTHSVNKISEDPEVEGVFISADPAAHFSILCQLLKSNKKVLVEKPPCSTIGELQELISLGSHLICKIGLQRRYWPGNRMISERIKTARSYTYQFHFGSYPQGDPYTELFIHALDYCRFLFGDYQLKSFSELKHDKTSTVHLHITHQNRISGLVELSTDHSWKDPVDLLNINCKNEWLKIQYPLLVEGKQKPVRLFNIPAERLLRNPVTTRTYYSINNLVIPSFDLNTLAVQGFYQELETFISLVENPAGSSNIIKNDLPGMLPVYELIKTLKGL